MWEYTDKVKEHFLEPRNAGELEDATVSYTHLRAHET